MSTLMMSTESSKLFFGEEGHGIARYDKVRYPIFKKLNDRMQGFFWRPTEIDLAQESRDFHKKMTYSDRWIVTSNLQRQIVLDTEQGRGPSLAFLPHVTDPSLENCILTWSFFESIHSESYTHIIQSIYPDPSVPYEAIPAIKPIVDCAADISAAYDSLIANPNKENLYLALMAANALESIRFYVSFACTFSFAERGLIEGSAKINRLIARDESQHMALVQNILKVLPLDDSDYIQIAGDNRAKCIDIFDSAASQEETWIDYLFSQGPVLGISPGIMRSYVNYLKIKRKAAIGLGEKNSRLDHPLPWVERWHNSSNVQLAPQDVEIASYVVSSVQNDASDTDFSL